MLVGSSATGKTSAVKCLVLALELQQAADALTAGVASPLTGEKNDDGSERVLGNGIGSVPVNAHCTEGSARQSHSSRPISSSIEGDRGCKTPRARCIAHRIFPKALGVEELYGSLDPTTREWRSGALEQAVREASQEQDSNVRRWIILDGPVDVVRLTQGGLLLAERESAELVGFSLSRRATKPSFVATSTYKRKRWTVDMWR